MTGSGLPGLPEVGRFFGGRGWAGLNCFARGRGAWQSNRLAVGLELGLLQDRDLALRPAFDVRLDPDGGADGAGVALEQFAVLVELHGSLMGQLQARAFGRHETRLDRMVQVVEHQRQRGAFHGALEPGQDELLALGAERRLVGVQGGGEQAPGAPVLGFDHPDAGRQDAIGAGIRLHLFGRWRLRCFGHEASSEGLYPGLR